MNTTNEYIEYKGIKLNIRLYKSLLKDYKRRAGFFKGPFIRKLKDEYFEWDNILLKNALIDNLEFLSLFKNLEYIELEDCEMLSPLSSYRFDSIKSLDITSNTGGDLHIDDWIMNCKNIDYLFIDGYENVYGFDKISECKKLDELYIVNCKNIDTNSLSECKNLTNVILVNEDENLFNCCGFDCFKFLKELPLIKRLRVLGYDLNNEIVDIIRKCTSLEEVELEYFPNDNNQNKLDISFIEDLPNINDLSLNNIDICNIDILYNNKLVKQVSLFECDGLNYVERFANMQQLTYLSIVSHNRLPEEIVEHYIQVISEKNNCELRIC